VPGPQDHHSSQAKQRGPSPTVYRIKIRSVRSSVRSSECSALPSALAPEAAFQEGSTGANRRGGSKYVLVIPPPYPTHIRSRLPLPSLCVYLSRFSLRPRSLRSLFLLARSLMPVCCPATLKIRPKTDVVPSRTPYPVRGCVASAGGPPIPSRRPFPSGFSGPRWRAPQAQAPTSLSAAEDETRSTR